uniref:Candidate secreted effector n=1 Tax=Meloidogyne incognita TaxID=6306 RepID=A0A914LE27_MELIC
MEECLLNFCSSSSFAPSSSSSPSPSSISPSFSSTKLICSILSICLNKSSKIELLEVVDLIKIKLLLPSFGFWETLFSVLTNSGCSIISLIVKKYTVEQFSSLKAF